MQNSIPFMFIFLLILSFSATVVAQVDPGTDNLVHSYLFEDEGFITDNVGTADGEMMGNAEVAGGSLLLAEADSWAELPAADIAINAYDEITFETWFTSFFESNTGFHMIVYFGTTVGDLGVNYFFMTPAREDDVSRAAISVGDESTPWAAESGANGPEYDDGELHHMVSTLNADSISLYIDGELQAITPLDSNNTIDGISTDFAFLGKGGYVNDPTWIGEIMEFNIYDRVLSAEEILFLFERGGTEPTAIRQENTFPGEFSLSQNYPNPFNPSTILSFSIAGSEHVSLKIYDTLGKEIANIVDSELSPGQYNVEWNASDLVSGIYYYRLTAGEYSETKKMMLLK